MQTFNLKSAVVAVPVLMALTLTANIGKTEESTASPQQVVYSLCGGSCSRSMRVAATYTNLQKACQAAEELRKKGTDATPQYVGIMTGKNIDPLSIHPSFLENSKPKSCSVVVKGQRCGNWLMREASLDLKPAHELAKEIRERGQQAMVIYNFPAD